MSCLSNAFLLEPLTDSVDAYNLCSRDDVFFNLDLNTVRVQDLDFSTTYKIELDRQEVVNGLVTWFDIEFGGMDNLVTFSTGPKAQYTHWKQTVFFFDQPLDGFKGETIEGSICARKNKKNPRAIDVKLSSHHKNLSGKLINTEVKMFKVE